MSEEQKGGFFSQIKNQIITGVGVLLTTIGTFFMDTVKGVLGIDENEGPAQTEMKQEVNVSGPEIIINIPEQKKDTVIKVIKEKAPVKPKEKEDIDW